MSRGISTNLYGIVSQPVSTAMFDESE
jgi:hypothetical protein